MRFLTASANAVFDVALAPDSGCRPPARARRCRRWRCPTRRSRWRRRSRPGPFTPPATAKPATARALPAFCRVAATLKPTRDSDIKIEVWMPASGWNGKFQAVGNGAFSGCDRVSRDGDGAGARLRDQLHRHRPRRQQRELRARASREGDRLRLARGARDDRRRRSRSSPPTTTARRSSRTGTAAPPADVRR